MKIELVSIFETSRLIATKSGAELTELIMTFANFVKQVVPALKGGLTFEDNFNCAAKVVELSSDVEQVVDVGRLGSITDVVVGRVVSQSSLLRDFGWWLDGDNRLVVKAVFLPLPSPANAKIDVRLLIFLS